MTYCHKLRTLSSFKSNREWRKILIFNHPKCAKEDLLPEKHFISPVNNDQMVGISKGFIPANTGKKSTNWPMSGFQGWRSARNRKSAEEDKCQCPEDLLEKPDIQELNYWISHFVAEV